MSKKQGLSFVRSVLGLCMVVIAAGCGDSASPSTTAGDGGGGTASSSSSGGQDPNTTCELTTTLTGGVARTVGPSVACVFPFGASPEGANVSFAPIEFDYAVELDIDKITKEKTGSFPTSVTIRVSKPEATTWTTKACTVNITSNAPHSTSSTSPPSKEGGPFHRLIGTGTCTAPALDSSTKTNAPAVTIGPFAFTFLVTWA